jgi:5-methyltetrahydrofolate--homocysteine methyltransferase
MGLTAAEFAGRVTIADGAWATELDKLASSPNGCREQLNLNKPEFVRQLGAAYVDAGAKIILTNTFSANRLALARFGVEDQVLSINRAGAQIARRAAAGRAHVFGSMGPSGKILLVEEVDEQSLTDAFEDQARALIEAGVDGLVIETMTELAEAVIAVRAAKATGLPVVACMTFDSGQHRNSTSMGTTPEDAAKALVEAGADIVGCNCGIGIEGCIPVVAAMRAVTDKPIWAKPSAGLPEIDGGKLIYKTTPQEFAAKAKELASAGAAIIGGCCGTTPDFTRALRSEFQ